MPSAEEVSMANNPSMVLDWILFLRAARSCWLAGATTSMMYFALLSSSIWRRTALARGALSEAMAICLPAPALRLVMELQPSSATISSGTSTVETRKARPRICSRYSRFAIKKILRMILASHGLDKNLFQRRLNQLEAVNRRLGRGLMQELLRVAVRLELDLGVTGEVLCLRNLITVQESGVSLKLDDHAVALVPLLDLAQIAGQHGLSVVDEANGVAELLHLIHAMGGKQDGLALSLEFEQCLFNQHGVHRVKAGEGLVHDDELGVVEQRGNELDLLLHALGELFSLFLECICDLHAPGPGACALFSFPGAEPMQLAEEDKLVDDLHFFIEAALFGQVADLLQALPLKGLVKEVDAARVGQCDAHHHANGTGFAGSVRPQQAEHLARLDG